MGTTSDKLLYLQGTKEAIKTAIVNKGVDVPVGTPFRDYATKIDSITSGGSTPTANAWIRPTEWLALPSNIDGVQKVSILNAVFDTDSEFVAFTCSGAYTVDWGDGVVENFASGIKAEHKYTYSNTNLNSATVTKFRYKQCIITITPQAGQSLTIVDLNTYHSTVGSSNLYDIATGFLDIRVNSLAIINLSIGRNAEYVRHTMLEQCLIGEHSASSFAYLFNKCCSLQSVSFKSTNGITDWSNAFNSCYALQKMPSINFVTSALLPGMFYSCHNLIDVPDLVLNSNNIQYMFADCRSLSKIKIAYTNNSNYTLDGLFYNCFCLRDISLTFFGTGKINSLSNTFYKTAIKTAPILDTSACTQFGNMFYDCSSLTNVPQYNYSSAISLMGMFYGCYSLVSVPNFNTTSACTDLSNIFNNCVSLQMGGTFNNTTNVTTVVNMYASCLSLASVPTYSFPALTTNGLSAIFNGCTSLQSIPAITFSSSITTHGSVLGSVYSLKRMLMPLRYSFSVANAKMSAAALNEMYTALPTVTGQTVTVTGNYGTASDNPAIATAKGWTVTG